MESLQSTYPPFSLAPKKASGKDRAEKHAAAHGCEPIPGRESSSSPLPRKGLSGRQVSTWPVQRFASPAAYETQAIANMGAFIAKNSYEKSLQSFSDQPPAIPWLSPEQVQILTQSNEGETLLMLINDLYQLATICTGRKGRYSHKTFEITEHSPFKFSVDPIDFLENMRSFFQQTLCATVSCSPYCHGIPLNESQHPNLTRIDIINFERLLVKAWTYQVSSDKFIELNNKSLLIDFIRVLKPGSAHYGLLNLVPKAFADWVDMQSALSNLKVYLNHRQTEKLAMGINRFIWSFFKDGIVSVEKIQINEDQILNYSMFFLIPDQILPLLFQTPITDDSEFTDTKKLACPSTEKMKIPTSFPRSITTDLLTFGEEFEFITEQHGNFSVEEADKTMMKWHTKLEEILGNKGITDFDIIPSYHSKNHLMKSLDIRIGNWYYRIYHDFNVLEVNTSPYTLDQSFAVQGEALNVYQFFDHFVLDIAKNLHLPTRSGHKHIGIDKALHGNSEILLRLLLDTEKRGWFPRLFLREQRSVEHFRYMSQDSYSRPATLSTIVESFNQQLQIDPDRKINESFDSIKKLVEVLQDMDLWAKKEVPLNLKHLSGNTSEKADNEVREACTTIEFRFPQAPRTGKEAELLNRIFVAWLQLMEKHQHGNIPLRLEQDDPMDYLTGRDNKVMGLFREFIQELELDWDTFRTCSFLQAH